MWNKLFVVSLFYSIHLHVVQAKIDVIFTDTQASSINPDYIGGVETHVNDDTGIFLNFTLIKCLPDSTRMLYKVFTASMGQYVPTGVTFDVSLCGLFEPQFRVFGDSLEMIGINENNCLPIPGAYGSDNLIVPPNRMPEGFPPNDYLAVFTFHAEDENIMELKLFCQVVLQNPMNIG